MSLPSYLTNIKSSGFYRFVWDKSQVDNPTAEILRLVVGYSEKGPFNTPVYIRTQQEFIRMFGGISKKLEKRGVYFHRMALQALTVGPILCLNHKKFTYEEKGSIQYNTVSGTTFNPVKDEPVENALKEKTLKVKDIYDITRFWSLSPSSMVEAIDHEGKVIMDKYISFCAETKGMLSDMLFETINAELNECSITEEPIIIKKFDGSKISENNLDFENRLFPLIEELIYILSCF